MMGGILLEKRDESMNLIRQFLFAVYPRRRLRLAAIRPQKNMAALDARLFPGVVDNTQDGKSIRVRNQITGREKNARGLFSQAGRYLNT